MVFSDARAHVYSSVKHETGAKSPESDSRACSFFVEPLCSGRSAPFPSHQALRTAARCPHLGLLPPLPRTALAFNLCTEPPQQKQENLGSPWLVPGPQTANVWP